MTYDNASYHRQYYLDHREEFIARSRAQYKKEKNKRLEDQQQFNIDHPGVLSKYVMAKRNGVDHAQRCRDYRKTKNEDI